MYTCTYVYFMLVHVPKHKAQQRREATQNHLVHVCVHVHWNCYIAIPLECVHNEERPRTRVYDACPTLQYDTSTLADVNTSHSSARQPASRGGLLKK